LAGVENRSPVDASGSDGRDLLAGQSTCRRNADPARRRRVVLRWNYDPAGRRVAVMDADKGTVERAFELARDGSCQSVEDIRRSLANEGYEGVRAHLAGAAISRQLKDLLHAKD
jgi:hypothetical protein